MIGKNLAHYLVESRLGSGGMGQVYQARDMKLGRRVAIKVLPEPLAHDRDRIARLEREAKLLASLNHPNIASLFGIEEHEERQFLVMELVEGQTLAERIARGPIAVDEALKVAQQIAEALEAAHEEGIVHRDLKPANVIITPEGRLKVLDFGLAKAVQRAPAYDALPDVSTLSMAGIIRGTAAYMSPEQAQGLTGDARSDLFSFGCVLYEMLTGQRVFPGETVVEVLAAVLEREPDFSSLPPGLNPRIKDLLRRCLEKNPKRRWHAAADLRVEIETILADPRGVVLRPETRPATSPTKQSRRAMLLVSAIIVAALVGGAAVWTLRPSLPLPGTTRLSFTLPEGQQFSYPARQMVSISPDGTQVVYAANNRLYLKSMNALQTVVVQGTESIPGVQNPVFSPDGRTLAFWSTDGTLKRIPVNGGVAVTICKAEAPFGMSWGPDDEIVFGQGSNGIIMRVPAKGGTPERIVSVEGQVWAHGPQMLPGGKAILFTLGKAGVQGPARWDQGKIVVQFLDTGVRKTLIEGGSDARYVPTGHLVYVLRGALLAVPFDPGQTKVTGESARVVEGLRIAATSFNSNTGTGQFDFSRTGSLVYIAESASFLAQRQVALVDLNGNIKALKLPPQPYLYPRISPDGKQLALATDDGSGSVIWIYPLSGAASARKLTLGENYRNPAWFGDSEQILMSSPNREGPAAVLFRQRIDGTGSAERLDPIVAGQVPSYSPGYGHGSGENQLFTITQQTGPEYDVSLLSMKDRKLRPVDHTPGSEQLTGVMSPDGHWVAYSSNESGRFEIYVKPYPVTNAKLQITKDGGNHALWAPDGKSLYFANNGRLYSVAVLQSQPTLSWSDPVQILPATPFYQPDARPRHYDVTPDGKQFVMLFTDLNRPNGSEPPQLQFVLNWFSELQQRSSAK